MNPTWKWVVPIAALAVLLSAAVCAIAVSAEGDDGTEEGSVEYGSEASTTLGSDDVNAVKVVFHPNSPTNSSGNLVTASGGYTQWVYPSTEYHFYFPTEYKASGDGNDKYDAMSCEGYTLLGWSTDKKATEPDYAPGAKNAVTANTDYYAVWEEKGYADSLVSVGTKISTAYQYNTDNTWGAFAEAYYNHKNLQLQVEMNGQTYKSDSGSSNSGKQTLTAGWLSLDVTYKTHGVNTYYTFTFSGTTPDTPGTYTVTLTTSKSSVLGSQATRTIVLHWSVYDPDTDPSNIHHVTYNGEDASAESFGPYGTTFKLPGQKVDRQSGWGIDTDTATYPLGGQMTIRNADRVLEPLYYSTSDIEAAEVFTVVAYNANGGTSTSQIAFLKATKMYTNLASTDLVKKQGCTCIGWNETGSSSDPVYPSGYLYYAGSTYIEMKAVWVEDSALTSVTATFIGKGDSSQTSEIQLYAGYTYRMPVAGFDVAGYELVGWSANDYDLGKGTAQWKISDSPTFELTASKSFYAVYSQAEYTFTINYRTLYGTGSMEPKTGNSSTVPFSIELDANGFTREGYTFLGWADTAYASSPNYRAGGTYTVTYDKISSGSATVWAVWQKGSSQPESGTYTIAIAYSGNGSGASNIPSGVSVDATPKTYTIVKTVETKDNGKETRTPPALGTMLTRQGLSELQSLPDGYKSYEGRTMYVLEYTLPSTIPSRSGYTFGGWADTAAGDAVASSGDRLIFVIGFDTLPTSYSAKADLYAVWKSSSGNEGTHGSEVVVSFMTWEGVATTKTVSSGTVITAPSVTREGYAVQGWFMDDGTQWDFTQPVMSSMTLTVHTREIFDLTVSGNSVQVGMKVTASLIRVSFSDGFTQTYTSSTIPAHTVATRSSGTVTVTATMADGTFTAVRYYDTDPDAKQTYTVSFYKEDGSLLAEQDVKEGEKATRLTDPEGGKYYYYTDAEHTKTYRFDAVTTDTSVYVLEREDVYDGLTLAEIAGAAIAVIGVGLIIAGFVYNPYLAIIGAILAAFGGCELLGVFSLLGRIL